MPSSCFPYFLMGLTALLPLKAAAQDFLSRAPMALSSATLDDIHSLIGPRQTPRPGPVLLTVFPENLQFQISWGPVDVGTADMDASRIVDFAGRPAYHVVSRARSNSFCDVFYKVRDLNESWLDTRTLSSLGYSKNLREGRFFRDEWVVFEPASRAFLSKTTSKDGTISYSSGTIPSQVQDILSSLYYIRSKPLTVGQSIVVDVNTKKNWPLTVRVLGRERVHVPAGDFDTVLVEPALREHGIFIQKGRRLRVWLSDDARKIPVQMKVEILFGHIAAKLMTPKNGLFPFSIGH